MSSFEQMFFCIAIIYLLALLGFLTQLKRISRWWRLGILAVFCAVNMAFAGILRTLAYLSYNIQSGERALKFFTELAGQLANDTVTIEYLPMPTYTASIVWGIISLLGMIAAFVVLGMKFRWYSWIAALSAMIFAFGTLGIQTPYTESRYIRDSNLLRKKTYSLIEQKRKENVSTKQLSDAIKANLKDFHYSYENRKDEKASSEKILTAMQNLQPEK